MQYVMKRISDLDNYLSETSCQNDVNLPTHYHKYGANNHVYFISQDMGMESQSKNKETRAIQEVDKWITQIENVFSGMICY